MKRNRGSREKKTRKSRIKEDMFRVFRVFFPRFPRFLLLVAMAVSCARSSSLPQPGSNQYRELVSAFYVGLAGLQTGEDVRAREKLTRATEIAPGEPAAWANLGLLSVRQQEFDAAYEMVERARSLAPEDSRIESLLGLIESRRGKLPEAIAHFEKAVALDKTNLKALYALAQEVERQSDENADLLAQRRLEEILAVDPDNIAVLVDLARLAAKRNDVEALKKAAAKLLEKSGGWPEEAKKQVDALRDADTRAASTAIAYLRNTLLRVPAYRRSLNDVKTPPEFISDPFLKFLKLPSPSSSPAAHDDKLGFESQPLAGAPAGRWEWIGAVALNDEGRLSLLLANHNELQIAGGAKLPFPGAMGSPPLGFNAVLGVDLDYDFKTDLVLAGAAGVLIYKQENAERFIDVTDRAKLPASVTRAAYVGAWAIDIDLDGDLDVLLGAATGPPVVLRNNGDGTFSDLRPFAGVADLRAFAAADIDGDGDPDAALLDARGNLNVFINERLGEYRPSRPPQNLTGIRAVVSADLDRDGIADFAALDRSGRLFTVSDAFASTELAAGIAGAALSSESADPIAMFAADFDNNGGLDLIVAAAGIYLSDEKNAFRETVREPFGERLSVMDINDDGRLDMVGLRDGVVVQFINRGTKNYHHQKIRTRAAKSTGDQRINSFGIGGEIEIRAGLLTQKQIISSPVLHFGLGDMTEVDVARIVWPNGSVQAEFELRADESILAEQRLKGSCPMLFAWDGNRISYVKDAAPWSPALGLHINAQVVAGIYQTEEWFRIRGDQLAPRDGYYDLRVTAELWETYYLDHYSLMVVDHPEGAEVFADERFAVPPPPLRVYATKKPQPFESAVDDLGADVTHIIRDLDEKYLDTFGKGRYQGVARDHWVELELPEIDDLQAKGLYLIGDGFLHPTDGSINIAYGQTSYPPPQGLSIETPDASGNWKTARSGLGFPAGKRKTIVLDLNGVFRPAAPRRLRLRTNMEIYWDRLEWAEALPDSTYKMERVALSAAELRYRGFSRFTQADDSSPELPDYNVLESTAPRWRDLIGYYTRHGDVRELLEKIDDRMVIVNAGDEVRLRFPALPPPPAGWIRDFIFVGDGWIKDGDLNSTFSKTVLPLPYHGMKHYTTAPRKLEDDPAYRRHPEDWQRYHTRYVTPERFVRALRYIEE